NFEFIHPPIEFNKNTKKTILQYCLGATLYMPGTKNVLDKITTKKFMSITSMVMDFEDAIDESEIESAENNVLYHLDSISKSVQSNELSVNDIPLIFIRTRNLEQFDNFLNKL